MTLRAQDREDIELERKRNADLLDAYIRSGQLDLDKETDAWKKQLALEELGLKKESQDWDREYGLKRLALTKDDSQDQEESEPPITEMGVTDSNSDDEEGDALDKAAFSRLLRRIGNQKTEDEKLKLVWSMYQSGTISGADAEQLLRKTGVDTSKFNG